MLTEAVTNLIENARLMALRCRGVVALTEEQGEIVITVKDDGIGILEDLLRTRTLWQIHPSWWSGWPCDC